MSYSSNPLLPRARAQAVRLVVEQQLPVCVAARKSGIHRTTLWRWKQQWTALNANVQLENDNRPNRTAGSTFRQSALRWTIPTLSSRPRTSPKAIPPSVIDRICELRMTLKRCAEVVWYYLVYKDRIVISLSSVRRILRRNQLVHGRKKRVRPSNPIRPQVTRPGELVQTDTIHYICPFTGKRRYAYTVIDLYTRMAYAEIHDHIGPVIAARAVLKASEQFGFRLILVQADNGPEFSRRFEQRLTTHRILLRHSRLHRPNDNAHIERFNRTIQEECLGRTLTHKTPNTEVQARLTAYLDFYNTERVHLSLQYRTPQEMLQRF